MRHLTTAELLGNTTPEAAEHLAGCEECGRRLEAVTLLRGSIADALPATDKKTDCPDGIAVAEAMDGLRPELLTHIKECGHCLSAAGYYLKNSAAMAAAEPEQADARFIRKAEQITETKTKKRHGFTERWLFAPAPAYAAAAMLIIAIAISPPNFMATQSSGGDGFSIYKTESASMPLFFFGANGKAAGRLPGKMEATAEGNSVRLKWEGAPDGKGRYLILQEVTDGMVKMLLKEPATGNELLLKKELLRVGARYRWMVTGPMEGGYFKGEAEFTYAGMAGR